MEMGDFDNAKLYFDTSIYLNQLLKDTAEIGISYNELGHVTLKSTTTIMQSSICQKHKIISMQVRINPISVAIFFHLVRLIPLKANIYRQKGTSSKPMM